MFVSVFLILILILLACTSMARAIAFCAGAGVAFVGCNALLDAQEQFSSRVLRGLGLISQKSSAVTFHAPLRENESVANRRPRIVEKVKSFIGPEGT